MNKQDILGRSLESTDTVTANGKNYGSDVPIKDGYRIGENKVKAVFRVTTAFAAGNFTLEVCSGASASPTTVVANGVLTARDGYAVGDMIDVPIPAGVLGAYNRLCVNNTSLSGTGAMEADLRTVFG